MNSIVSLAKPVGAKARGAMGRTLRCVITGSGHLMNITPDSWYAQNSFAADAEALCSDWRKIRDDLTDVVNRSDGGRKSTNS